MVTPRTEKASTFNSLNKSMRVVVHVKTEVKKEDKKKEPNLFQ